VLGLNSKVKIWHGGWSATKAGICPIVVVAVILLVAVEIAERVLAAVLATNICLPSVVTAIPSAPFKPGMVAVTVFVAVEITETVQSAPLATYRRVPSGVTASPVGIRPTGIAAVAVLVAVEMTVTLLLISLHRRSCRLE